jgi:hypothetical protein
MSVRHCTCTTALPILYSSAANPTKQPGNHHRPLTSDTVDCMPLLVTTAVGAPTTAKLIQPATRSPDTAEVSSRKRLTQQQCRVTVMAVLARF